MILRFHWITLIMIYLVIIAGSIVRITESGMGCPDWPKCFDQYIPPTDVSQLPENYQLFYSSKREKKIKKFTSFLTNIGLEEKAILIQADKSLLYEQPFNVWNTWLEYINRLIGALAGIFIFIGFLLALFTKRQKGLRIFLGLGLILLTLFQAWWGSMVVATNIVPWVLTRFFNWRYILSKCQIYQNHYSLFQQMMKILFYEINHQNSFFEHHCQGYKQKNY